MPVILARVATIFVSICLTSGCAVLEETRAPIDRNSSFDLAEYLFNNRVLISGDEILTTETYFEKSNVDQIAHETTVLYANINGTIRETDGVSNEIIAQFFITPNTIEEQRFGSDAVRTYERVVKIGDTFLNADDTRLRLSETCELLDYFANFNLASATGANVISRKTYRDVIKVRCESNFYGTDNRRNNFRWNLYYAKGVGPVFKDGNWTEKMGLIYTIYNY